MDSEKIGKFIKQLREEKNWTQEQLAEKMFYERTKVNRLEAGEKFLKLNDLIKITEIFNITLEELIAGEKQNKNNTKNIQKKFMQYLLFQNKKLKICFFIILFLILLCIVFFSTFVTLYFFNNYKSIHIYNIRSNSDYYKINNGLMILSKDRIYFNLGNITPKVNNISIYSEFNDEKKLVYKGEPNVVLRDFYGYESLISYEDFINQNQNIYIVINEEEIKLNFDEEFVNDKIIYIEEENIGSDSKIEEQIIPKKIKENFVCEENSCHLETKNENMNYMNSILTITKKNEYYYYNASSKILSYENDKTPEMNFSIKLKNDDFDCLEGNCNKVEKIYKTLKKQYLQKYLE
ncbi:MAG: helix-turn-helix transcriptional regulator [Bacilli bacterium]|nr:helix-turn-helix transcriptional regulator [Bacilli bacterium]